VEVRLTLLDESEGIDIEARPWGLAPSVARVDAIDTALRKRLAGSLAYLAAAASLAETHQVALESIGDRLSAGPVSPWVFCLYSKLVAQLAKAPGSDVSAAFAKIAQAATHPADAGVVALRDPAIPGAWWDHARLLFDTDRKRPFSPTAPSDEAFALCQQDIDAGLAVLRRADPVWHQELKRLVRLIVLAAPSDPAGGFNGASTFFFWGAAILNSAVRRNSLTIVDLLVHESSHILLFGVSADGALTENSGHERYDSPLRKDRRPIDGIFHACFVATRVHLAMRRMLACGALNDDEWKLAVERAQYNGNAARIALEELDRHANPTALGAKVLDTLHAYWAAAPAD
jgi:HEXXH motif-containing protein